MMAAMLRRRGFLPYWYGRFVWLCMCVCVCVNRLLLQQVIGFRLREFAIKTKCTDAYVYYIDGVRSGAAGDDSTMNWYLEPGAKFVYGYESEVSETKVLHFVRSKHENKFIIVDPRQNPVSCLSYSGTADADIVQDDLTFSEISLPEQDTSSCLYFQASMESEGKYSFSTKLHTGSKTMYIDAYGTALKPWSSTSDQPLVLTSNNEDRELLKVVKVRGAAWGLDSTSHLISIPGSTSECEVSWA
eukprot:TRINITY_DN13707_c0_g2_i1.p1 TRINITY_DN13707_c0_g2~~TRINITY_DN13707_c0_g2_i1.p1  ORF type:complete len:244 (-),score=2.39 TRINITY_DN13707_c0_g2_i1:171-902(-)